MSPVNQNLRNAVCGELPTACDFLLRQGVVQIDQYMDAAELSAETAYYLVLIYIPNTEGGLNTVYSRNPMSGEEMTVPIRLLNEPACHSVLLELKSMVRRIAAAINNDSGAIDKKTV